MKIISYSAYSGDESLIFHELKFETLNLLVGDSATGKTRLLNTIFNAGVFATHKEGNRHGMWDMVFEHKSIVYHWKVATQKNNEDVTILVENIIRIEDGNEVSIVKRTTDSFYYNDSLMPKLSPKESAINMLKDEELIKPLHEAFSLIIRRNFSGGALEEQTAFQAIPNKLIEKLKKSRKMKDVFEFSSNLSGKLYILSKLHEDKYIRICNYFKSIFPFVTELMLFNSDKFGFIAPQNIPVFALKEKGIEDWIPINDFSSGMVKVLLLLTDIETFPEDGVVYLIDEIENSLGISSINSFPSLLLDNDTSSQFIITSHHPYIINKVPISNWIVLHRTGKEVFVKQGNELESKYGQSKQKAFVQLINDPFYKKGLE